MKSKFILTVFLFVLFCYVNAQNRADCEKIVQKAIECINAQSVVSLTPFLDSSFTVLGKNGEAAKNVLNSIFAQLPYKVLNNKKILEEKKENVLMLKYTFTYSTLGEKNVIFYFTPQNKLLQLDFSFLATKTLKKEENSLPIISNQTSMVIPFMLKKNGLIVVEAFLNGQKRKFILDSGAPFLILNSKYTASTHTKSYANVGDVNSSTAMGMDIIENQTFEWAGIKLEEQKVLTQDLSQLEEKEENIYGLIGFGVFRNFDILFDYQSKTITLIYEKYLHEYLKQVKIKDTASFFMQDHIPIITYSINKKNYKMGIDAGATVNLLSPNVYTENLTLKNIKALSSDTLVGVNGLRKIVRMGKIKKSTIGKTFFKDIETVEGDLSHINKDQTVVTDGLIGYPILKQQKTLLSYSTEKLYLIQ